MQTNTEVANAATTTNPVVETPTVELPKKAAPKKEAASTEEGIVVEKPKKAAAKKVEQQTEVKVSSFKELDSKKAKSLEKQVKEIKGVKEATFTTKAKRVIIQMKLKKEGDDAVFQRVIELATKANFKVGRSYFIENDLTVNLTQN